MRVCKLTGCNDSFSLFFFLCLFPAPQLLGVWVLQVWEQLGKPAKFQLVEFGPGKGTLMQDVLRVGTSTRKQRMQQQRCACSLSAPIG